MGKSFEKTLASIFESEGESPDAAILDASLTVKMLKKTYGWRWRDVYRSAREQGRLKLLRGG